MKKLALASISFLTCTGAAQAFTSCVAQAEHKWNGVLVEATSQGDSCENAVLTLSLRNKDGKPLWVRAMEAGDLMNFATEPAADAKAMVGKLSSWISGEGFMPTADRLVLKGEFPFTPSSELPKDAFEAYRKQKRPIFCFVQGMESGTCLTLTKEGQVVELGFQAFPG